MSDHYHDQYAYAGHDHDQQHTHYDLENLISGLRGDLSKAEERIHDLEQRVAVYGELIDEWRNRVYALERPRRQP